METSSKIKVGNYVKSNLPFSDRYGKVIAISEKGFVTVEYGTADFINNFKPMPGDEHFTLDIYTENDLIVVG